MNLHTKLLLPVDFVSVSIFMMNVSVGFFLGLAVFQFAIRFISLYFFRHVDNLLKCYTQAV